MQPQAIPLVIAYESRHVLVLEKPAGMAVHPTLNYHSGTLANAYMGLLQARGEAGVFRPVNRIDKDTSGLVLCAKNAWGGGAAGRQRPQGVPGDFRGGRPALNKGGSRPRLPVSRAALFCGVFGRGKAQLHRVCGRAAGWEYTIARGAHYRAHPPAACALCPHRLPSGGDELYGGSRWGSPARRCTAPRSRLPSRAAQSGKP